MELAGVLQHDVLQRPSRRGCLPLPSRLLWGLCGLRSLLLAGSLRRTGGCSCSEGRALEQQGSSPAASQVETRALRGRPS